MFIFCHAVLAEVIPLTALIAFAFHVWIERILFIAAGFILVYPNPVAEGMGLSLAGGVAFGQWRTRPQSGEISDQLKFQFFPEAESRSPTAILHRMDS